MAHTRELDVSSCGGTQQKALQNLKEAVGLFLEEAGNRGTLEQILAEAESRDTFLKPDFGGDEEDCISMVCAWMFTRPVVIR